MATNRYFENLYQTSEQSLYADLLTESIQIYGVDVVYIVRDIEDFDEILREEKLSRFKTTYNIEGYMPDTGQCEGLQNYMSKFGYRFEETTELIISSDRWNQLNTGFQRPREGDFIYIGNPNDQYASFVNCTFQINSCVPGHPEMFQFGKMHSYRLYLTTATKTHNNIIETEYDDVNEYLNVTDAEEFASATNSVSQEFEKINIINKGNPFRNK